MAGTVPSFSLSQQFDEFGNPLAGCKLYTIVAGTTATPQTAYQDSALTQPLPNPIIGDAAGRLPQFFLADGVIKIRLTDKNGVNQNFNGSSSIDNVLVIGPSGGGGGGGVIDATTILATGDLKTRYGTGPLAGFVRANGRTIGSATSGGSERANADCQALFEYLWTNDAALTVSTGRGASANADWTANKTIALPDWRGRVIAGLDDMGSTAASRITNGGGGVVGTTLGAAGGAQNYTLAQGNLPNVNLSAAGLAVSFYYTAPLAGTAGANANFVTNIQPTQPGGYAAVSPSITGNVPLGGSGSPYFNLPPMMMATIYLKL